LDSNRTNARAFIVRALSIYCGNSSNVAFVKLGSQLSCSFELPGMHSSPAHSTRHFGGLTLLG
jgi:hypothetical protein